jgi:uncharacterized protein (TIGR00299 family) protein
MPPNPAELLGSATLRTMLDQACTQFDLVMFDGPAGLVVRSDTLALATVVDGTVAVVRASETSRCHLRGIKAEVICPHEHHPHRSFTDIERLIRQSRLKASVQETSVKIFRRLAEAEGRLHGHPPEEVKFHEVGAIDSIVDIVGSVAGIEQLGLERVYVSRFRLGTGMIEAAHGSLPASVPAALELMIGFETETADVEGELVTPTGAAILTTLAVQSAPPPMILRKVGYGAGTAERERLANLLRLSVGETVAAQTAGGYDQVCVIETNVDDMTPEVCGYLYDKLFAAGAIDAWLTPVQMKKSRPGLLITCLCPVSAAGDIEAVLFAETSTFGVRRHLVERTKLIREMKLIRTPHGDVHVKLGYLDGALKSVSPEYEDCRKVAERTGIALREIYAEVLSLVRAPT